MDIGSYGISIKFMGVVLHKLFVVKVLLVDMGLIEKKEIFKSSNLNGLVNFTCRVGDQAIPRLVSVCASLFI